MNKGAYKRGGGGNTKKGGIKILCLDVKINQTQYCFNRFLHN